MLANSLFAATAVLLAGAVHASPIAPEMQSIDASLYNLACLSGVRVITARGSDTPQDSVGPINWMGDYITSQVPGSSNHNLVYPATLTNYGYSESSGVNNLTQRIVDHVNVCPKQRFVLIGYSQGAQVIGDTLIGYTNTVGQGLPEQYRKNIVAVIQFGDPDFIPGLSFDTLTAETAGVIPRTNSNQYQSYGFAPNMQSYCLANDMYCASGNSLAIHESYFDNDQYTNQANGFIMSRIHANEGV